MKKSLFLMAAASALMLTACTNEDATNESVVSNGKMAVGFDTYMSNATRAGGAGIQTTTTLKEAAKGFGVFAQHSDGGDYDAATGPNFMYNEHVTYSASSWIYSPLKYWPNETALDWQGTAPISDPDGAATSTNTDKLSFFAYAPYVAPSSTAADAAKGKLDGVTYSSDPAIDNANTTEAGIQAVIANNGSVDPWVRYAVATTPSESVDLLWGVAPAGGLNYQSVNPTDNSIYNISIAEGLPLKNLVKPAKDQKIKFLFKHALARIGLSVVAAIDQIAPGGSMEIVAGNPTTKIYIESVELAEVTTTNLYLNGSLNLNNVTANEANWVNKSGAFTGISITGTDLNADLAYGTDPVATLWADATKNGVTTTEKKVIAQNGGKDQYFMVIPSHANTTLQVTVTYRVVTKDDKVAGGFSNVQNIISKKVTINDLTNNKAYNLKLVLGLTSVKLDAEVADWQMDGDTEVYLPQNKD